MRLKNRVFFYELTGIVLIFLAALPRRLIFPLKGLFAFNYDQGRDFLAVSKMIYEKDLVLIGPTTGLQGIFYGPWWYYFLAPLIFLSGGDPQKVAVFFSFIGVLTIVFLYLLLRTLTKNNLLSALLATITAFSNLWMFGPTNIWSPSLTPIILIINVYAAYKIFTSPQRLYFFLLGLSTFLIADTTASLNAISLIFLIALPIFFKKYFYKTNFIFAVLGSILILLPRILFEVKNNFLMTKSLISYLIEPRIYGERLNILSRLISRIDQMYQLFLQGFLDGNKLFGILFLSLLLVLVIAILKRKQTFTKIKKDNFLMFLLFFLITILLYFTVYPDRIWDYYLIMIPTLFVILIAKIFNYALDIKFLKLSVYFVLILMIIINFKKSYLPPYNVTWKGDGATYVNEKKVMDYISSQNPHNYSFFAYSPAIFDYPFDYLVWWYSKRGLIENPMKDQNNLILVIREVSTRKYLTSGWYGDKTRDNTKVLDKEEFPGNLLVEKHEKLN